MTASPRQIHKQPGNPMNPHGKRNVALLMGRGGSKSIPRKNVHPVLGRPLVFYPMWAALHASRIDTVYVTTDCPDIQAIARAHGVGVIGRPPELSRDDSQMVDGILHALEAMGGDVQYLVTLHCNCATHRAGLIDECLDRLDADPHADSCVSGVIDKAVHPFRTRRLTPDGHLEPWLEIPSGTSSNRQTLEPCVILDGAARAMRVSSCFPPRGDPPFSYLGRKILMAENPGGRDVHEPFDFLETERFLRAAGWTENAAPPSRDPGYPGTGLASRSISGFIGFLNPNPPSHKNEPSFHPALRRPDHRFRGQGGRGIPRPAPRRG